MTDSAAQIAEEIKMVTSSIKALIPCGVRRVWDTVLDVENYSWRSDLSKTEVISESRFIEYTKDGCKTTFTVTSTEPYSRWEFDIRNANIKGHWTGLFTPKGHDTEICFTEQVAVKNFFMKPFIKFYLRKQQALFVSDLKKALLR